MSEGECGNPRRVQVHYPPANWIESVFSKTWELDPAKHAAVATSQVEKALKPEE
jgi:hypothetical protein